MSSTEKNKSKATTPTLNELLKSARKHVMTAEEREAQRQSWVRGEMAMGESERGMTSRCPPLSEGTMPQAERLHPHGCYCNDCYSKQYLHSRRAVAPVETPEQCLDLWHKEKGCNAALLKCPTCGLSTV